jgi:hypothetical protein
MLVVVVVVFMLLDTQQEAAVVALEAMDFLEIVVQLLGQLIKAEVVEVHQHLPLLVLLVVQA